MIWPWWGAMCLVGILVGCIGAWTTGGSRVFMKTLAVPLILLVTRLALPNVYPIKNTPLYVFIDFVLIAGTGFIADYYVGLKLGRHGRDGYRTDSVGH